ncbi:hypothetical protein Tco_1215310 [Tanacetum coccineum]
MLPGDPVESRTLMEMIGNYTLEDRVLYRKSYLVLLMGSYEIHDGPRQGMDIVGPVNPKPRSIPYLVKMHAHSFSTRNSNHQQQQVPPAFVEPFNLVEPIKNQAPPVVTMDDTRTMAQLLEAPTDGYEDAIVVPEITADNFELKHGLLTLVQNKQFFGYDKEDPHAHYPVISTKYFFR